MADPWGKEAYILLKKSISKAVDNHLEKLKFELQGFPLAFHLWILESVPLLQSRFSKVIQHIRQPTLTYLCEKYIETESPKLDQVIAFQNDVNLKVICILPPILDDPENDVSFDDEPSEELESIAEISMKGYKFKISDWINRNVDIYDALFEMTVPPTQFENVETFQSSTPNEESVIAKLNKIVETMEKNFKIMKDRLFCVEEENKELKARVSELEGNKNEQEPLS